eukprot:9546580-Lingulodinium_polyedra.AAC.1
MPGASLAGVRLRRPRAPSPGEQHSGVRVAGPPAMAATPPSALPCPATPVPPSAGAGLGAAV